MTKLLVIICVLVLLFNGPVAATNDHKAQVVKDIAGMSKQAQVMVDMVFSFAELGFQEVETAKYLTASADTIAISADLLNRYPDRFLFGTDEVAPPDQETYLRVYYQYASLFNKLDPKASEKLRLGNYERLFDEAKRKVRAWERANR